MFFSSKYGCLVFNHFSNHCFITNNLEDSNFVKTVRSADRDDDKMAECFELALSLSREGHMHQSILYH